MGSNLRQRICRTCGKTFWGGPRAWYCPICREERQRLQAAAYKLRKRDGDVRPIGSMDQCVKCGDTYTVSGPNQMYCPACAPEAVRQADRAQGLAYYRANRETRNPERNARRRKPDRVCAICGAEYTAYGRSKFCSAECRRVDARRRSARTEEKRRAKRKEKRMEKTNSTHGGARPGAGRPKGATDKAPRKRKAPTSTRQVTMPDEVWRLADDVMARLGMSRPDFFELAVRELAQKS